jgi:hypothetical protein
VSFQEFPWLIISLFSRGEFGPDYGPNPGPISIRSLIGMVAVLTVVIVVAVCHLDC